MCFQQKKPFKPEAIETSGSHVRYKLWELPRRFHCSIIGTCLNLEELRYLYRKANAGPVSGMQDYELHTACVMLSEEHTFAAKLINKTLDRKFKNNVRALSKLTRDKEIRAYWSKAVESGDVAGSFWALLTQSSVSDDLISDVYGQVHMLSHIAGATLRVNMQELQSLKQENRKLKNEFDEYKKTSSDRLRQYQKQQQVTAKSLAHTKLLEAKCSDLGQQLELAKLDPAYLKLRTELSDNSQSLDQALVHIAELQAEVERLRQQDSQAANSLKELQQEMAKVSQERDSAEARLAGWLGKNDCETERVDSSQEAATNLCGRCILYVGGRNGQCAHFKSLVEQCNGQFLHHDGGKEDSRMHLGNILSRADAVMCPLDCISHDAFKKAKQFCENHAKPFVMLPRASLSAFSQGLYELDA